MNKLTAIALCALTATFTAGCALDADTGSDAYMDTEAADVQIGGDNIRLQPVEELQLSADGLVGQPVFQLPGKPQPIDDGSVDTRPELPPGTPVGGADERDPSRAVRSIEGDWDHCWASLAEDHSVREQLVALGRHAAGLDCTLDLPEPHGQPYASAQSDFESLLSDRTAQAVSDQVISDPSEYVVATHCGNGIVEPGEQCDDANAVDTDGCGSSCRVEAGFVCMGAPSDCADLRELRSAVPVEAE